MVLQGFKNLMTDTLEVIGWAWVVKLKPSTWLACVVLPFISTYIHWLAQDNSFWTFENYLLTLTVSDGRNYLF